MRLPWAAAGGGRSNGGIFISYRATNSFSYSALLHLELSRWFGESMVFLDCESIPAGSDFARHLLDRLRRCEVLLAVVGPDWLSRDTAGLRHIDDQDDWVRRELTEAFAAGLRVIPVLTDGADMPTAAELPGDIAAFGRCQYRRLRRADIRADLGRLVADLTGHYSIPGPATCRRCRLAGQLRPAGGRSGLGARSWRRFRRPGTARPAADASAPSSTTGGLAGTARHHTAR